MLGLLLCVAELQLSGFAQFLLLPQRLVARFSSFQSVKWSEAKWPILTGILSVLTRLDHMRTSAVRDELMRDAKTAAKWPWVAPPTFSSFALLSILTNSVGSISLNSRLWWATAYTSVANMELKFWGFPAIKHFWDSAVPPVDKSLICASLSPPIPSL